MNRSIEKTHSYLTPFLEGRPCSSALKRMLDLGCYYIATTLFTLHNSEYIREKNLIFVAGFIDKIIVTEPISPSRAWYSRLFHKETWIH